MAFYQGMDILSRGKVLKGVIVYIAACRDRSNMFSILVIESEGVITNSINEHLSMNYIKQLQFSMMRMLYNLHCVKCQVLLLLMSCDLFSTFIQ